MQIGHAKSITIADATGTVTAWFGTSTVTVAASALQLPADWNSKHNLAFTLAGNTTVGSTVSGTNIPLAGTGGVSLGVSNGSLLFSAHDVTLNNYRPFEIGNNTTFSSLGQNSIYLQAFIPDQPVFFSNMELTPRGTFVSSTNSQQWAMTLDYGLYSQQTGASSTQMSLAGSSRLLMSVSFNSNTAAGFTISQGAGSYTISSAGTAVLANISGPFHLYLPFTSNMVPNVKHAVGLRMSTATTVGTSPMNFAPLHLTMMNSRSFGRVFVNTTQATNTTVIGDREMGIYNTTSASLVNSYATSQMGVAISRANLYVQFED
jgi:hypothetical protein